MSMELDHSFTVPVPPDQAWNVLLDVEKIAPCMPGAQVDTVDGDDVAGRLKVKVGPVSLTYKGTATFKDRDTADRSVLVEASGKELRGAGTAIRHRPGGASPRGRLRFRDPGHAAHHPERDRPAQFGRGVIAEVGSRLIDKFADNLAKELANGGAGPASAPDGTASAPDGTASAPDGTASAPDGTASAPDGTASAPDGTATTAAEASPGSPALGSAPVSGSAPATAPAPATAEGSAPAPEAVAVGGAGSAGEPLSAPTSASAGEAAPAPASSGGEPRRRPRSRVPRSRAPWERPQSRAPR